MMRYACRAIAGVWLVGVSALITSVIGKPMPGSPATWRDALVTITAIAIAMALGWLAGRESKESE